MRLSLGIKIHRQIAYSRNFTEIIRCDTPENGYIDYHDDLYSTDMIHDYPAKEYVEYHKCLEKLEQQSGPDMLSSAEKSSPYPFFEILIVSDSGGYFAYKVSLFTYDDVTKKDWRTLGDLARQELERFEMEKTGKKGHLFNPPYENNEMEIAAQSEDMEKRRSFSEDIRKKYHDYMGEIKEMLKSPDTEISTFAKRFGLSEKVVEEKLFNKEKGTQTPSRLALRILEDSPEAKELGIRNGGRLYDEIIMRGEGKEFPKRKRYISGKRSQTY